MRNWMVLTVAVATVLLSGCGNGESAPQLPAASSITGTPITGTPAATRTQAGPAPAAPQDASPKQGTASADAALTVTDIRLGRQPGFDRVVYDLGGVGTPGWLVRYTDRAVQDGSGNRVDVAGRSILEVRILGSAYPFDSGVTPYSGPDPAVDPAVAGVAGVYRTTVFEGATQSFIGVQADRPPFTVTTLSNPTRLVVDIASP
ncbi:AMIN-like domain-containing (lipo)protein [Nocardia gipuzkoensis]|uniref:AMIN-like domain-containing (lipo)protein n=1 Tax=Nocardia gipuzkoensis TaxID=2749991 RepID=UPI003EE351B1